MPFAVTAGAISGVEQADVHVFHAEVSINHGFGLGPKIPKKAQKHYDEEASFHGNKGNDEVNCFCPYAVVI